MRPIMDSTEAVYQALKEAEINFIASIPCVNLGKLLELVECDPEITHVPVTREEEGFGIAAGAYMGGMKPAILMQNSGLGNSVNVLASLYQLYKIPIIMGKATPRILDALELPYFKPETPEQALNDIKQGWNLAQSKGVPVGILLEITFW